MARRYLRTTTDQEKEACMRAVGIAAAAIAMLVAGCGGQSHSVELKSLTPSEARNLLKSIKPGCDKPGRVLVRYVEPEVHGKGGESWWCSEPARMYGAVSRDVHCPARMHLTI